jgi:beta-galactosidase GanA
MALMLRTAAAILAAVTLAAFAPLTSPAGAAPVEYDRYSMILNGKRTFLNGGEVHYYRMPSPRAWPRMVAKLKAAGLNEISIYVPWQIHEPRPGRFRFGGRFDLDRFLRDARDAGLYVVVRPGPYVQAEIDGGKPPP